MSSYSTALRPSTVRPGLGAVALVSMMVLVAQPTAHAGSDSGPEHSKPAPRWRQHVRLGAELAKRMVRGLAYFPLPGRYSHHHYKRIGSAKGLGEALGWHVTMISAATIEVMWSAGMLEFLGQALNQWELGNMPVALGYCFARGASTGLDFGLLATAVSGAVGINAVGNCGKSQK